MKYIYVIFLIGVFNTAICSGQIKSVEIIYKVKIERKKSKSEKINKIADMMYQEVDFIEVRLKYDGNNSSFKVIEIMEIDSKRKFFRNRAIALTGLSSDYFININDKRIIREREFDGRNYNITSNFDSFDWKLINESKKINDFLCYKALTTKTVKSKGKITNIDVEAWYTPKLSIPLGPKNYVNLPGLILELKEGRKIYYTSKINLNSKEKLKIDIPKKGIVVTELEYSKIIQGSVEKLLNSMNN